MRIWIITSQNNSDSERLVPVFVIYFSISIFSLFPFLLSFPFCWLSSPLPSLQFLLIICSLFVSFILHSLPDSSYYSPSCLPDFSLSELYTLFPFFFLATFIFLFFFYLLSHLHFYLRFFPYTHYRFCKLSFPLAFFVWIYHTVYCLLMLIKWTSQQKPWYRIMRNYHN